MSINATWHKANKMPKNPSIEKRVKWHKEHLKKCGCRKEIPESLKQFFKKTS